MVILIGKVVGGVGLFLVGSELLRRGFQDSAGYALRRVLANFTDRTSKGILAGFAVSSAVQSATAVIATLIGFVSAGMLPLQRAVAVVFGANLGKITIALIIACLGFKLNITAWAMPIIGLGAFLKIFLKNRNAGIATGLMAFGLIFLGIDTLKTTITEIDRAFPLAHLNMPGQKGLFVYFLVGMLTTFVTQSSTGAIVITLSALAANIFSLENAMALVIGENLGTTSSTLIAATGTTPTAKRLGMAHVLYNAAGTAIGIVLLEALVLTGAARRLSLQANGDLTLIFTAFYCSYIFLTLVAMLPFEDRLVIWLKRRFHDAKALGTPRHFDPNRLYHPAEAIRALHREILRFGELSAAMLEEALKWEMRKGWVYPTDLSLQEREMDRLNEYIHWFASRAARHENSPDMVRCIQALSMASRHFESVSDLSKKISKLKSKFTEPLSFCLPLELLCEWSESLRDVLERMKEPMGEGDLADIRNLDAEFKLLEDQKVTLRGEILDAGASRQMTSSQTIILIDLIDTGRRGMRDQFRGVYETWQAKEMLSRLKENARPATAPALGAAG